MLTTEAHDHSDRSWTVTITSSAVDDGPSINVANVLQALATDRLVDHHIADADELLVYLLCWYPSGDSGAEDCNTTERPIHNDIRERTRFTNALRSG